MAGIAILGMYLQYKSWKVSRTTKEKPPTTRSRRVVLNDNPNRIVRTSTGTGTYRGKTAPVPVHNTHSWRNPGGPTGSPVGNQTAGYATAKSDNAGKYTVTYLSLIHI